MMRRFTRVLAGSVLALGLLATPAMARVYGFYGPYGFRGPAFFGPRFYRPGFFGYPFRPFVAYGYPGYRYGYRYGVPFRGYPYAYPY